MNYMYERGRSTVGEWRRLNRGQSSLWCNNHDDTPTVGPVALLRATWKFPYGYLGVTCANRSGPSVVWAGSAGWTSRLSEPCSQCSHGLKWKSIRCGAKAAQKVLEDLEPRLAMGALD